MDIDFWLIQKMRHGDENAFNVFVHKHYPAILKYCHYHCPDLSYSEDITQETFLRFFERLSEYRYIGKTRNYLYVIAGNLCKDYGRKRKESFLEEQAQEAQSLTKPPETEMILNKVSVEAALGSLPDELREVIVLRYFYDLKLTEIAGILRISLPLVKYRMGAGKKRLRQLLKEDYL